jgi:phosphoglycolate phosphatase
MARCIVFDFDGTIADSRTLFVSVLNDLAGRYGFKKVDADNIDQLKKLPLRDRFAALGIPLYKIPFLTKSFLQQYRKSVHTVTGINGMDRVLEKLTEHGFKLAIASSNSEDTIRRFLQNNNISTIDEVHCSSQLFGKDKLIRKFLSKTDLHHTDVIYVGDEERDIVACQKVGVRVVWVAWGFDSEDIIRDKNPDHIARTPDELVEILVSRYKAVDQLLS